MRVIIIALLANLMASVCWASWSPPYVVLSGTLGEGDKEFGIMEGD